MFDQLFTRQAAVVRYQSSPFAAERQLYLKRLVEVTLPSECVPLNVLVLGDIYPRGRRGGGSVEIAPAISKG